jgi:hypothetical protein
MNIKFLVFSSFSLFTLKLTKPKYLESKIGLFSFSGLVKFGHQHQGAVIHGAWDLRT